MNTSTSGNPWMVGWRALRRDWRSGELRLLATAIVLAVAAICSVGFLTDRVERALGQDSAQMLGGDLLLQADAPIPPHFAQEAMTRGLAVAYTLQFPSMVESDTGAQLSSLKAVSETYPLRGALRVSENPGQSGVAVDHGPEPGEVWIDPQLLAMLDLKLGDKLAVGNLALTVSRLITYEPDRGMQFVNVAPRVMIHMDDIPASGLVVEGSRVRYYLMVAGPQQAVQDFNAWLQANLARGQQISTLESSRPEVHRALERARSFLSLVTLLTVMVAAIAVALAARRFGQRHTVGMAVMRCLGATRQQLHVSLWVEFLTLGLVASSVGALFGYVAHLGLVQAAGALIETDLPPSSAQPVLHGMVGGLLLLLGFAIPPLAGLHKTPPVLVLRHQLGGQPSRKLAYLACMPVFFALVWWISGDARLSGLVAGGFLLAMSLFAVAGYVLVRLAGAARHVIHMSATLRFALAGINRRRALTVTQLCALSLGLMVLLLLTMTRTDLLDGWRRTLPPDAPNTFVINIQPDQREGVLSQLQQAGIDSVTLAPMVRGRLVAINQQPVNIDDYDDDRARRMVDREFNLSYTDSMPASNHIVAGRWLDPSARELSLEDELAETLGISLGDTLSFDVAGQTIDVTVTSLRQVKWDSFDVNFFALLSPVALQGAPASFITSFHLPQGQEMLSHRLVRNYPNLTVFDVGVILQQIQRVLDRAAGAVQGLFLFTLLAGALVLGAAMIATRDERMHEAAILRAIGASAAQLRSTLRLELMLMGALAGLLGAAGAVGLSWVLATMVFDFAMQLTWWPWFVGIGLGMAVFAGGGAVALHGVLDTPPLASLRAAE